MPLQQHSPASSADSRILDLDTLPSSTSTATSVFPRPAGTTVSNIRIEKEPLISPALSGFTFNLDPEPSHNTPAITPDIATLPGISFSDPFDFSYPKAVPHAVSPPPTRAIRSMAADSNGVARSESAARRVQYFNNAFSNGNGAKEDARGRVQRDSPIIAELRTNVIIKDEYTPITSLSQHLSERYRRPESAVLLTVTHSTCLMMGGSFEPAYILDITAIPSDVQPTTNKRNAYLIQAFMADALHVPSDRGVVRFTGVEEDKIATNGTTVAGDIERAEKDAMAAAAGKEEKIGLVRTLTSKSSRLSMIGDKRKSMGAVVDNRKSVIAPADNRKSMVKSSAGERMSFYGGGGGDSKADGVFQTLERKFSTRSLRSLKSQISPPIPTEFPVELLPSPTSLTGFSIATSPKSSQFPADLQKIHRLSPLHTLGRSSPTTKDRDTPQPPPSPSPLSQHPTSASTTPPPQLPPLSSPSPSPPRGPGTEKEPIVTSSTRRPTSRSGVTSPRPQSSRKSLSNITGPAEAIPSPPPIPDDHLSPEPTALPHQLRHKLSKRKSFVSLFTRKVSDGVRTS